MDDGHEDDRAPRERAHRPRPDRAGTAGHRQAAWPGSFTGPALGTAASFGTRSPVGTGSPSNWFPPRDGRPDPRRCPTPIGSTPPGTAARRPTTCSTTGRRWAGPSSPSASTASTSSTNWYGACATTTLVVSICSTRPFLGWEEANRRGVYEELTTSFQRAAAHMDVLRRKTTEFRDPVRPAAPLSVNT